MVEWPGYLLVVFRNRVFVEGRKTGGTRHTRLMSAFGIFFDMRTLPFDEPEEILF